MEDIIVSNNSDFFGFHIAEISPTDFDYIFPNLCIARIIKGNGKWKIGLETLTVSEGDIVLLNNLEYRRILNGGVSAQCFWFPLSVFADTQEDVWMNMFYFSSTDRTHKISSPETKDIFDKIIKEFQGLKSFSLIKAFTVQLVYTAYRRLEIPQSSKIEKMTDISVVLKALQYINKHICEGITVSGVAKELYISREHFTKLFTKYVSLSPSEYISGARISHFKRNYNAEKP